MNIKKNTIEIEWARLAPLPTNAGNAFDVAF